MRSPQPFGADWVAMPEAMAPVALESSDMVRSAGVVSAPTKSSAAIVTKKGKLGKNMWNANGSWKCMVGIVYIYIYIYIVSDIVMVNIYIYIY